MVLRAGDAGRGLRKGQMVGFVVGRKQEKRWRGVRGGTIYAGRRSPMVEMVEFGADSGVGTTLNPRVRGRSVVVPVYFESVIADGSPRQTDDGGMR